MTGATKKTAAEKRVKSVFVMICNFKSQSQGGTHLEGSSVQIFERGERMNQAPVWWKSFPRKRLEEQLSGWGEGNRRLGLRGGGRGSNSAGWTM